MSRHPIIPRSLWLPLVGLVLAAGAVPAKGLEFNFRKPTPLSTILETIGAFGKFNVVLCDGKDPDIVFRVTDVSPHEALNILSMSHGLRVYRVDQAEGRETYLVGTEKQIVSLTQNKSLQVVSLRFQDAETLESILRDLLLEYMVKIKSVKDQNILVLQGPRVGLKRVVEILTYLDLPVPSLDLEMTVERGQRKIWTATLRARSGRKVTAVVGPEDGPSGSSPLLLTVEVFPRVNKDRLIVLDASIGLALPPGAREPPRDPLNRVATTAQLKDGEELEIARFQSPTGPLLAVRVKATIGELAISPSLDPADILSTFPRLPEIDLGEGTGESPGSAGEPPEVDLDVPEEGPELEGPGIPPDSDDLGALRGAESDFPSLIPPDEAAP